MDTRCLPLHYKVYSQCLCTLGFTFTHHICVSCTLDHVYTTVTCYWMQIHISNTIILSSFPAVGLYSISFPSSSTTTTPCLDYSLHVLDYSSPPVETTPPQSTKPNEVAAQGWHCVSSVFYEPAHLRQAPAKMFFSWCFHLCLSPSLRSSSLLPFLLSLSLNSNRSKQMVTQLEPGSAWRFLPVKGEFFLTAAAKCLLMWGMLVLFKLK